MSGVGKKAENQFALLKESEKLLKLIIDNTPDPIYVKDKESRMIMANPACEHVMGHTIDEMRGKNDAEIYSDQQIGKKILETDKRIMNSRKTEVVEEEIDTPEGKKIYLSTKTPLLDDLGQVTGILGISRDITERKSAEEALRKTKKDYDLLFDNMSNGFAYCKMLFDEEGKAVDFVYLQINEMFEKITGLKSNIVVGRKVTEAIPGIKEATPELFTIYGRVAQTGNPEKFEVNFTPLKKWLSISVYSPEKGYFAAVFEDISERKKAEQAVERQNEERLKVYLESTPSAVFVANPEGKYIFVNQGACNLLGYSKEELLSMSISQVLSEDYLNAGLEQFKLLKQTGRSRRELCLKRKDGSQVFVILTATKLPDGNFIANCEDLTERKELEKQLQAKESLAAIGQTAGMVGHDIRNPLQAMTSDLYLIKEELKTESANKQAIAESVEEIQQNIDYVNKIVADLQDYTRPVVPNKRDTNVKVLVDEVIAAIKVPQTIQTDIQVASELTVITDPDYLRRILSNLILNAIQAMPSGGTLEIQVTRNKNMAVVIVEDTGVGISDEVRKELFKPLFTTKAKGQGLGLAVVKHLVEGLNGSIKFESQVGKGTKFIIELPIKK